MSDYIKREDAINVFDWGMPDADVKCGIAIQNINDIPSADVRENVRGEWIFKEDRRIVDGYDWKCDQCGSWQRYTSNFCPHCGADMR